MSDSLRRRHGLEFFLRSLDQTDTDRVGVHAHILDGVAHINLRGHGEDVEFLNGVEKTLGQPLPLAPNTVSNGEHHVYWLGPDEWLIVSTANDASVIVASLQDALIKQHVSINDISGGQVTLRLQGTDVRETLSKGCTIDLHVDAFRPGECAQSGLAKAGALIGCFDGPNTLELIVRRSFADYLARWLQHAARDSGIEFRQI